MRKIFDTRNYSSYAWQLAGIVKGIFWVFDTKSQAMTVT